MEIEGVIRQGGTPPALRGRKKAGRMPTLDGDGEGKSQLKRMQVGVSLGMTQVMVRIPESTPLALGLEPGQFGDALVLAAAVQWYESGKLSSGAAAELAGIPKPVFLQRLNEFGVAAFRQTREELREEISNA